MGIAIAFQLLLKLAFYFSFTIHDQQDVSRKALLFVLLVCQFAD
ncbi:hypothetical protein [Labilibaculum euxinus]|nr:hypothetical protein [Labilibaculum euxinus]